MLLRSATGLRSEDFDLDRPVSLGDLARAWPIDARTVGIRRPILFVGFTVPESSEFVTVLALPPNQWGTGLSFITNVPILRVSLMRLQIEDRVNS